MSDKLAEDNHNSLPPTTTDNESAFDERLRQFDGKVPWYLALPLGLQHMMAMYFGSIAPVLIIAGVTLYTQQHSSLENKIFMVQSALLMAGLGTLLQVLPIGPFGSRLPLVTGVSFSFLYLAMTFARQDYSYFVGASILCGIFIALFGFTVKYWRRFIDPIIPGCVVAITGICLTCEAISELSRGQGNESASYLQLVVGAITIGTCIFFQQRAKGNWRENYILVGLLTGGIAAFIINKLGYEHMYTAVHWQEIKESFPLIYMPRFFHYIPKFDFGAIVSTLAIGLVVVVEAIGNVEMISFARSEQESSNAELGGALTGIGLINTIGAGLFGVSPLCSYSQNASLVCTTKIFNRRVIMVTAAILILGSLCPLLCSSLYMFPTCVIGGCMVVLFAAIIVLGAEMLYRSGINRRNITIAIVSMIGGIIGAYVHSFVPDLPEFFHAVFDHNPVAGVFIVALILTLLWPRPQNEVEQ